MGRPVVPRLIGALSQPQPEVRKWSAVALGQIGDKNAVEPLKQLEKTAGPELKWVVAEQLRRLARLTSS